MGSFNQAVFYYLKTNSVLKKYSYIPSFKSILVECEAIIASLKDALLNQARSTVKLHTLTFRLISVFLQASLEDTEEAIALLLDLKEPPSGMRQDFLSRYAFFKCLEIPSPVLTTHPTPLLIPRHGNLLFVLLEGFAERIKTWRKENHGRLIATLETDDTGGGPTSARGDELDSEEKAMHSFLSRLNTSFLGDYLQFSSAYHRLFIQRASPAEGTARPASEFEEFTKDLFDKYLVITRAILLVR